MSNLSSIRRGLGQAKIIETPVNKSEGFIARVWALTDQWQKFCNVYLPIIPEDSIWRLSRLPDGGDPEQGWKLHVSATILSANQVFERVAPFLSRRGVLFKAPRSLEELDNLNCGLKYGFSQVGKFITVYTRTVEETLSLASHLHHMTCGLPGPTVPFDRRFLHDSRVHYRYGAFADFKAEQPDGTRASVIRNEKGEWVPDIRAPGAAVPDWISDPFLKSPTQRRNALSHVSPLKTTFLAFETISQRGKGGVYRALDLSVLPARLCILKEGRKDGETDWEGKDGCWRVRHEATVLSDLSKAGVGVPQVYATFEAHGNSYLVLELVEGRRLDSILNKKKGLPLHKAIDFGGKLARLLASIHSAGWVWRDCKPANLVCTRAGELRPLDMEGACRSTQPELVPWSSPGYYAPGAMQSHISGSVLSEDLFALGTLLHYLVTGRPASETEAAPPVEQLKRRVPRPVRAVIAALLRVEPEARPAASTVAEVLEAAL